MADILRVDPARPDERSITRAAACLREGGLVAFPTETVYGLGVDATNASAVRRLFQAKGRPSTDPLIVHVANIGGVQPLVTELPDAAVRLASEFWPGPLTLVLPRSPLVCSEVTAGLRTVAVRVPAHPVARALVAAAGIPIAAPSANLFSRPSPTRAEHVAEDLGDAIDLILDAGPTPVGLESTVVDLTHEPARLLRPGGVPVERLRGLLPELIVGPVQTSGERSMPAPGMLSRHYAPRTPLTLFEGAQRVVAERVAQEVRARGEAGARTVILGSREMLTLAKSAMAAGKTQQEIISVELGSEAEPDGIAARLYSSLRECDALHADRILALQVADAGGMTTAVRDRLRRASDGQIVTC